MINRSLSLGLILSSFAFAQLDSNSVTVTASRSATVQPDQAVFALYLDTGLTSSLDDVVAALQGSGITSANFSGVRTTFPNLTNIQPQAPKLEWTFGLPVPLSKMKDTITALTNLQQTLVKKNNGFTLSFDVQGVQVSTQLQKAQPCSISDLLSDARAQAQKLTDAAGFTLGTILGMSSATSSLVGNGNGVSPVLNSPLLPLNCTVTVKFAVLRYQ